MLPSRKASYIGNVIIRTRPAVSSSAFGNAQGKKVGIPEARKHDNLPL